MLIKMIQIQVHIVLSHKDRIISDLEQYQKDQSYQDVNSRILLDSMTTSSTFNIYIPKIIGKN